MLHSAPLTAPAQFNIAAHCLTRNLQRQPDRTALVLVGEGGREARWSFREVDDQVRRLAAGLRAHGLAPGSRIMIRLGNGADYALLFLAAIAAGLVALPASADLTAAEAGFLLADSGAAAVALAPELPLAAPPGVLVLGPDDIERLRRTPPLPAYAATAAEDPAYLVYTSGTTARPKGVLHAQRAAWGRRPIHRDWLGLGPDDVMLHAGALNWTYTMGVGLLDPWACGATTVLYNGPRDPAIWPHLIARYGATIFAAVPSLYRQILKYAAVDRDNLGRLRHGVTAGEALSPDLLAAWRACSGRDLYEALGMSEVSTYISSGPEVPVRPGSPGRPQSGRRVTVLPPDGEPVPLGAGEVGLLAVHRSDPTLMLGYWNRPDEDAAVRRGDWFVGGDLAAIDGDGYVWYHGRADDLMNAMGYRVSPVEVEAALAGHPGVAEVAVAELAVRRDVTVIAAFVVPKPEAPPAAAELLDFAAGRLATYKCPREIVFIDRLPRTANGKVMRRELARRRPAR